MSILPALALATLATARTIPTKDLPALADAALRLLDQHGLSAQKILFHRLVKRALVREDAVLPLSIATPSGSAGKHAESIASFIRLSLGKPVEISESADAHLLGGALLAYHDERFDASLRGALTALHRRLSSPLHYDAQ